MQIGDDLYKARRFVDAAQAGLARLKAEQDGMAFVLSAIQKDASEMHARGIARSAESALEAVSQTKNPENIQLHIFSLTQLLRQYTEGLDEISPVTGEIVEIDTRSEHQRAKDTLAPLIRFAPAQEQQAALSLLSGFEPELVPNAKEPSGIHIESVMPMVTDHIMSEARRTEKSVSVSYAVGDILLPEDIASDIQDFMIELGGRMVADNLAPVEVRQAAGLPPSGIINITAQQQAGRLELHIECSGKSPAEATLNLLSLSPLIARSGIFSVEQAGDKTIARLINVDLSSDLSFPMEQPVAFLQEALA